MKLKIEYVPIDSIQPYENNAKLHPAEQVEQIRRSIEEFGFNDPVAVWNGTVVEGHGRLLAAQEMGLKEIPVIRLDGLSDEQRRAYTLVHNKVALDTGFDYETLEQEVAGIQFYDMTEWGFERPNLEDLDFDSLESGSSETKEKKKKYCVCPYCLKKVEVA